ncbi:alpha-amylase family glycosyl hydrolase [Halarchaeum sp. P4]|uniref:alpha-amylase family glycosyl hydrolase n=1 Tax=Halarchaeum sp. P4 TaxID=3421639 RepID=UPI003EBEE43F
MHQPGPPRFCAVGESVELAPRAPDPDADYKWTLVEAPDDDAVTVTDDPVLDVAPDTPGTYRFRLAAPDGDHEQTVRVFPDERVDARFEVAAADLPVPESDLDSVAVIGPWNDQLLGRDHAHREGDSYVLEKRLPPGEHYYNFCANDDLNQSVREKMTVEGPGRPRIRVDATVDGDTLVVEADARAAPNGAPPDVEFYVDDRDRADLAADLDIEDDTARVPLDALGDRLRVHAVPIAERYGVADHVDVRTDGERVDVRRPNDGPDWAASPTIYEIFVRSFAGDTPETTFTELERRVPYLDSLDVDCVWLTPVLESPTTHGYHITDYFDTASDLGTRAEFESFVDTCHDHDIRVIFDLVINHTSRDHPFFHHFAGDVPDYEDYYIPDADSPVGAQYYFNWSRIPNLNFGTLDVREFLLSVVDEWSAVVDGFRCDVAWGVPHGFWKEVADRTPDDFLLLDETVPRDPFYHEGEFTVHYDTSLYDTLREIGRGDAPASELFDALNASARMGFPDHAVHMRYVENHDEDRYLDECDEASLRAAAAATFTLPGAPMIYYGQERGMTDYRGKMAWHDGDRELTAYHRRLTAARREYDVLADGSVSPVAVEAVDGPDADRVVAYRRDSGDGDALVAVLNFGSRPATVRLGDATGTTDLLTGEECAAGDSERRVTDAVLLHAE